MARTLAPRRLSRAIYGDFLAVGTKLDTRVDECLNRDGISIIEVDGAPVGMIQLFDQPDAVEVGEIQIQPSHQNQRIDSRVLKDTIARVHEQRKKVLLSVALKNERAYQLYQRLGFQKVGHNDTHNLMAYGPQK